MPFNTPSRLDLALSTPPSPADREGKVYLYWNGEWDWKFGRSNDVPRLQREWARQCPTATQIWLFQYPTKYTHKLGNYSFDSHFFSHP